MATYKFKKIDDNTSQLVRVATNADCIRAMTDEELADELLSLFAAFYDVEWSLEAVLDWLKQEGE